VGQPDADEGGPPRARPGPPASRSAANDAPDRARAARLPRWVAAAQQSGAPARVQCADFMERRQEPILNYFVNLTSSGWVAGLNNKIKWIKRQAFGFRNDDHFRLRVPLVCEGAA